MIRRVKENNCLRECQQAFGEWGKLNIIERVPEIELYNKCRFLPYKPIIKMNNGTAKIRPVFDSSANKKGKLYLNSG